MKLHVAVVIPALNPSLALPQFLSTVSSHVSLIIVVNDGSDPSSAPIFDAIRHLANARVIDHERNLGKGAALKTGIDAALSADAAICGLVTADADGQHSAEDVLRVAQALTNDPNALILGSRKFDGAVPFRSRLGNIVTRAAVRLFVGRKLIDTQSGLRGIPVPLAKQLMQIPSTGYEFELDMLIACKHRSYPIREVPIRTIYEQGNPTSHFNPLTDSMRIYFVLLRFTFLSLITAALDNTAFIASFYLSGSVWKSQAAGRIIAICFNYVAARRAVFLTRDPHSATLPKYLLLVFTSGVSSYAVILSLTSQFGLQTIWAKIAAESLLFLVNFWIQRDFVFTHKMNSPHATDWDAYYQSTPPTAKLTRQYTRRTLISLIDRFAAAHPEIVEFGGANSCFADAILERCEPRLYQVIDSNQYGLDLLKQRFPGHKIVKASLGDVLAPDAACPSADLVFSIGLIEHFDIKGTSAAIASHFKYLKPGGCAIISFPTPTWLYRSARAVCEALGLWKFPDERPLGRREVIDAASDFGELLFEKTMWPLVFTQHIIVIRKHGDFATP